MRGEVDRFRSTAVPTRRVDNPLPSDFYDSRLFPFHFCGQEEIDVERVRWSDGRPEGASGLPRLAQGKGSGVRPTPVNVR